MWVVFASNYLDKAPLQLWEARKTQLSSQPEVLYSWDNFREWCLSSFSVHDHETYAISQLEKLRQTGSVAEYKAAHDVLAAQTTLPMKLRLFWWECGLKDEIRVMCSLDPLTHKQYADIEAAQNAACACDAHLKSASAAAASCKRGAQPSTATARVHQRPHQRAKFADHTSRPAMDTRIAKWRGDAPADFACDTEGRLAEPLPGFFKDWIAKCDRSGSGRPLLPDDLLREGNLPPGLCFYKGCMKSGHRWDRCPKLAMHVAKNPSVRTL